MELNHILAGCALWRVKAQHESRIEKFSADGI